MVNHIGLAVCAQVSLKATAEQKGKLPLHPLAASAIAVLPSGLDVLSAGEDGKVWSLSCQDGAVVSCAFDPLALYQHFPYMSVHMGVVRCDDGVAGRHAAHCTF